jgi:hypothetical protein
MESSQTDFHLVVAGHKCAHCNSERAGKEEIEISIAELRQVASDQCTLSRIRLACIDWAIPRFLDNKIKWMKYHTDSFSIDISSETGKPFCLEIFEVDGRLGCNSSTQ